MTLLVQPHFDYSCSEILVYKSLNGLAPNYLPSKLPIVAGSPITLPLRDTNGKLVIPLPSSSEAPNVASEIVTKELLGHRIRRERVSNIIQLSV